MSNRDNNHRAWTQKELEGWWFMNVGDVKHGKYKCDHRSWEDCRDNRFMTAGGGKKWSDQIKRLNAGNHLLAYASGAGYVGAGIVHNTAMPLPDFYPHGSQTRLIDMPLKTKPTADRLEQPASGEEDKRDWCIPIDWKHPLRDRSNAVNRTELHFSRRIHCLQTVCQISDIDLVRAVLEALGVDPDDFNEQLRAAT